MSTPTSLTTARIAFQWFRRDLTESLIRQPLRTALILLAVGLGTLSLTLLLAILSGLRAQSNAMIDDFGANIAVLELRAEGHSLLDPPFLERLQARFPHLVATGEREIHLSDTPEAGPLTLVAAGTPWPDLRARPLAEGRLLDPEDIRAAAPHAVAGRDLRLRPGDILTLRGLPLTIVGVAGDGRLLHVPHTLHGPWEPSPDSRHLYHRILLRHRGPGTLEGLARELAAEADRTHPHAQATVLTPETLIAETRRLMRTVQTVFGSVVALCLLLGGGTLMTLMTLTVQQRIREIGLRMAMGADRPQIFRLFLAEGLLTTGLAGALGLAAGLLLLHVAEPRIDLPIRLSPTVLLIPPAVALLTGFAFSLLPARAAATLSPAQALRLE